MQNATLLAPLRRAMPAAVRASSACGGSGVAIARSRATSIDSKVGLSLGVVGVGGRGGILAHVPCAAQGRLGVVMGPR